ncbi:MAG TPA: FHA domain-containing protein [Desulfomonilia bacterium]
MKVPPIITVQLIHLQGPLKGQIQEFSENTISIGRQTDSSVQFPKDMTTISRQHAIIERDGNRFKLTDKSANGTFVNGKKITETYLKDGDVIMFTEGGPKVSFIAEIKEVAEEAAPVAAPQPQKQEPVITQPVSAPEPPADKPAFIPPSPETPASVPEPPLNVPSDSNREKVQVPLMIQFGPALRSYKELPVTIGKSPSSDFVMAHPNILANHAQIVFSQGTYRIRDLTGKNLIRVNGRAIEFEAVLGADDVIHLSPNGPALRFLGEGRLAEHEEIQDEEAVTPPQAKPAPQKEEKPKGLKGFMDLFKK